MTTDVARYDGWADWYDDFNAPYAEANGLDLSQILGPGEGLCLDLGCGSGHYLDTIASTGRDVVGVDFSSDQLRIARRRGHRLIRADAARLPFPDAAFRTVVAMWISTDVDDFAGVLREVARVLEPGGAFVFWGVHPCFNGPHIQNGKDDSRIIHATYREAGWHSEAPYWGENIRRKVGMRHMPLAEFLNAFIAAGLTLEHATEPGMSRFRTRSRSVLAEPLPIALDDQDLASLSVPSVARITRSRCKLPIMKLPSGCPEAESMHDYGPMSTYFRIGDLVLWNPSNGVASLFMATAEVLVPVAGVPLGVLDMTGQDEYWVDPAVFGRFVNALGRRYLGSSHLILRSLIEGFLATALVLVERAGGSVAALTEAVALDRWDISVSRTGLNPQGDALRLRDLAEKHARAMPI